MSGVSQQLASLPLSIQNDLLRIAHLVIGMSADEKAGAKVLFGARAWGVGTEGEAVFLVSGEIQAAVMRIVDAAEKVVERVEV